MRTEAYGTFSLDIHRRVITERIPLNASLEITRRCNLTCGHCYNNLPVGDRQARAQELSLDELRRILDEMAAAGTLWLLLTGGEIFARADFFDIYRHAKQKGFLLTLFTNGTMITPAIADELAALPPFMIEITLYGGTRETYERLTGVRGSFDRCMRGIRLLVERGLPLKLKAAVVSMNRHEIPLMRQFAEETTGKPFKFDAMLNPRVDCSQAPLALRLAPEEVVELDARDTRRVGEWRQVAERQAKIPVNDNLYTCGGGLGSFAVNPYGEMTLCVLSQKEHFDLRKGPVSDGWNQFLGQVRARKATRPTKCVKCRIKAVCGMCPANGELHNAGDPEEPVAFLCETAHLRALAFGIPIEAHGACEFCPGGARHAEIAEKAARLQALIGAAPDPIASPPEPRRRLPLLDDGGGGCASGCSNP